MDLLTDLLMQAGLRRRLLDLRRLGPDAAFRFPCERSIGLHVVTQGQVYLHAPSLPESLVLSAGDIAVMARGCVHQLSPHASLDGLDVVTVPVVSNTVSADEALDNAAVTVISGAYQFWNTPIHPFFTQMPEWFVLRADSIPKLGPLALTVGMLEAEVHGHRMGANAIVHGLLDVIFTYVLRDVVSRQGSDQPGWCQAVLDVHVRQVLGLMHADCAKPWTLEDLAQQVGLSRTGLAERFRHAMSDTPLNYLRTVRMQNAMRLLSDTELNLEQVALEVGYQDAFSFSKVFKRTVGVSPRDFRRQDQQDDQSMWRFKGV